MDKRRIGKSTPIGVKYNKLTIVEESKVVIDKNNRKWVLVNCICDCGNTIKDVELTYVKSGRKKTCGCHKWNLDGGSGSLTWSTWNSMVRRCTKPNNSSYDDYGGRGITVCKEWLEKPNGYINFKRDMGERPIGTSIDRTDVNGNYELSNCTWATNKEQANNKRKGSKVGRRKGESGRETEEKFLSKHQDIIDLLGEGLPLRKISKVVNKSVNTCLKVSKIVRDIRGD